jgi:dolichol-phosphate mannosyltransferase
MNAIGTRLATAEAERIGGVEILNAHIPPADAVAIVPTYNESENIVKLLPALAKLGTPVDILVADDGSPDGTAEIVARMAASIPRRIILMRRKGKFGLGVCYLDAFAWARMRAPEYRTLIQMDADFSHDPWMLPLMIERANAYGLCVGSRYIQGGCTPDWDMHRILLSKGGNAYARTVLRFFHPSYPTRDNTAGFMAWRADVLDAVLAHAVPGDGYSFLTSLKFIAFRIGYPAHEVPVVFRDRRLGVSKLDRRIILEAFAMPWRLGRLYRRPMALDIGSRS